MKGAIISGATGMVGVALTDLLLEKGFFVVLLIRSRSIKPGSIDTENRNIHVVDCSLADYRKTDINIPGVDFDCFFHLAWAGTFGVSRDDARLQNGNVTYTLDAMDLARRSGCRKFVGLGSQAEYGPRNTLIQESDPVRPVTGYGIAKYQAGSLGKIYARQIGLEFCWGRLFSAYGPYGNKDSVLNYVVSSLEKGESPRLGACDQMWDFIHVDDVAEALYLIAEKGRDGETYNIATGEPRILKDFIEAVRVTVNPSIAISYDSQKKNDVNLIASVQKLKDDTGFVCRHGFDLYSIMICNIKNA